MSIKMKALRAFTRSRAVKFGFFAGSTIAGTAVAATSVPPGLRKDAAVEGAIHGALIGAAPLVAKPTFNLIKRGIASAPKIRQAGRSARMVFRRIRGRIVPIRAK